MTAVLSLEIARALFPTFFKANASPSPSSSLSTSTKRTTTTTTTSHKNRTSKTNPKRSLPKIRIEAAENLEFLPLLDALSKPTARQRRRSSSELSGESWLGRRPGGMEGVEGLPHVGLAGWGVR